MRLAEVAASATLVEFLGSDRARMERARFTTCGPGDNAWWVQAESIEFDGLDETATATFATLYFKGLPVLASPILSFPTSDRRKSGFLTPSFGLSSTLGTDIQHAVLLQPCAQLRLHIDTARDDQARRAV